MRQFEYMSSFTSLMLGHSSVFSQDYDIAQRSGITTLANVLVKEAGKPASQKVALEQIQFSKHALKAVMLRKKHEQVVSSYFTLILFVTLFLEACGSHSHEVVIAKFHMPDYCLFCIYTQKRVWTKTTKAA